MRVALLLAALAGAASAQDRSPAIAFLEGQGCTIGPQSKAAAEGAGLSVAALEAEAARALAAGKATQSGDYVVLDADICTIRLPQIESRWSVDDPEIQAMAPFIRETFTYGDEVTTEEGCFFGDATVQFTELNGGDAEAGWRDYITFMAAGVISGDMRFYAPSPLVTPRGAQLMNGACGEVANAAQIKASHAFIEAGFETYVRTSFETLDCRDRISSEARLAMVELQGADPSRPHDEQAEINSWLQVEMMYITLAAGWVEGVSATERGAPRPPLCTYGQ